MFQSIFDDRKKGGHYQSFKVVSVLKVCEYSYDSFNKGQFLSHWELAEPVFCSEELSFLPYKNQNKSLTVSSLAGKFKFAVWWEFVHMSFFLQATFTSEAK